MHDNNIMIPGYDMHVQWFYPVPPNAIMTIMMMVVVVMIMMMMMMKIMIMMIIKVKMMAKSRWLL